MPVKTQFWSNLDFRLLRIRVTKLCKKLGMVDQKCLLARGKVLGGSTNINGAFYNRGHPEDYDRWVSFSFFLIPKQTKLTLF